MFLLVTHTHLMCACNYQTINNIVLVTKCSNICDSNNLDNNLRAVGLCTDEGPRQDPLRLARVAASGCALCDLMGTVVRCLHVLHGVIHLPHLLVGKCSRRHAFRSLVWLVDVPSLADVVVQTLHT